MAKPCEPLVLLPRRLRGSEISDVRLFTDSFENKIYAYDYTDGQVSGRRVFVDAMSQGLPEGTYPDGLCIDKDGGVWSARCVLTEHSCADMRPLIIAPAQLGRVQDHQVLKGRGDGCRGLLPKGAQHHGVYIRR